MVKVLASLIASDSRQTRAASWGSQSASYQRSLSTVDVRTIRKGAWNAADIRLEPDLTRMGWAVVLVATAAVTVLA